MDSADKQPLGRWLEHLRKSYTPHISMRSAAELAGLSEARWRQIENGYRVAAKDLRVPVVAPDETIAQMAECLAGEPDELRAIGYERAADLLARRQERMYGDVERTAEMADQLVQIPDDMLAAEVVRRILERDPRFEEPSYGPALTTTLLRNTLVQRYLRSPEDIAEDIRRLEAGGPETQPDEAGEAERKRVVTELAVRAGETTDGERGTQIAAETRPRPRSASKRSRRKT